MTCLCGDPECPSCGPAQGFNEPEPDEDKEYEEARQKEVDDDARAVCVEAAQVTDELIDALKDMGKSASVVRVVESEIRQPKWIKATMTVTDAARHAHMHGCYLRTYWDPTMGLRVVAVKR